MGRRHLIRLATIVALLIAPAAPAGAALHWRLLADGPAPGSPVSATTAYIALSRAATAPFSPRLPGTAAAKLARIDFSRDALVAIFGEFGCRDASIAVSSIEQHGTRIAIKLLEQPPKPGTMQCMAIYETYRLLLVSKSLLQRPFPTRADVTLARA